MSEIIYQLGGRNNVLILLSIFGFLFFVNSFIKKGIVSQIIAALSSLLFTAQISSLYFTQSFIGYQFYVHANIRGVLGMQNLFGIQMIFFTLFFGFGWFLLLKSNLFLAKIKWKQYIKIFGLIIFVTLLISEPKFIKDSASLLPLFQQNNKTKFIEVLSKNKMQDYVTPNKIQSDSKDYNIIIISMESLERAFLTPKFKSLTPNLNKLKKSWNYLDIKPNMGSEWTSGSMYTCLTGFPALFGTAWNDIFYTTYGSEITSISHVFNQEDYNTVYFNGNSDHSGVNAMLNVFEFDQVIDYKSVPIINYKSSYGLRDQDVFKLAKEKFIDLKSKHKKSAFIISTTDTHFPNGIYDERMEKFISKQDNDLEFTVASLDYLIGDFLGFLDSISALENTKFFLFPDHLKMGNPNMFKETGERSLYCISNADLSSFSNQELYQIDLPKIILKGSEINHNLKFFTDYIKGDKSSYIEAHQPQITEINTTGNYNSKVSQFNISKKSEFYNQYKRDTSRFIAHAGGKIDGNIYTNSLEALELSYSKGFRLFELDLIKTSDGHLVAAHDWVHWANHSGYKGDLPVTKQEFLSFRVFRKYTPMDMDTINKWFNTHPDAILVTDKVNEPELVARQFTDKRRLMMEVFTNEALEQGLKAEILSVMPSHDLVTQYSVEEIKGLSQRGINAVAISRRFINDNKKTLKLFKALDIKAYVFNLNMEMNINEEFVVKYEMDFIHGIYADQWNFDH